MEIEKLIEALRQPEAYPHAPKDVEVLQTHISVVVLADSLVYKIKKPVHLEFVDFSTLEKRKFFCEEEVRLNRRLAPDVYMGIVPIRRDGRTIRVDGPGEIVDWAVKMQRLPQHANMENRLSRNEISEAQVRMLAQTVARFHAAANTDERIASYGRFEIVANNARDNFVQSKNQIGTTLSERVWNRLVMRTDEELERLRSLIERRAVEGRPRDTHGDLRLDHVYMFPDRRPPNDLVIIDCIEFNEAFRFADPVADMAFIVMDLQFHGRSDLGAIFCDAYFEASGDSEGVTLLPFYTGYRAAVRAKVRGIELAEREIDEAEKASALQKSRAHWLLALNEMEAPNDRACLVMIGGLPGSGKSTLARALAEQGSFQVIRTDVVRKQITNQSETASEFGRGVYSPQWTERTYMECLKQSQAHWLQGRRVIVDAGFWQEKMRRMFLDAAACWCIPAVFLHLETSPEIVRRRLSERHGDASDADWAIYVQAKASWQEPSTATASITHTLQSEAPIESLVSAAFAELQKAGLSARSTNG